MSKKLLGLVAMKPSMTLDEGEIKGINAPRPKLEAVNAKFNGYADEHGVHLRDLTDPHNLPMAATSAQQTNAQAYKLASRVWSKVQAASDFREACGVLTEAGCKLHHWCSMD